MIKKKKVQGANKEHRKQNTKDNNIQTSPNTDRHDHKLAFMSNKCHCCCCLRGSFEQTGKQKAHKTQHKHSGTFSFNSSSLTTVGGLHKKKVKKVLEGQRVLWQQQQQHSLCALSFSDTFSAVVVVSSAAQKGHSSLHHYQQCTAQCTQLAPIT